MFNRMFDMLDDFDTKKVMETFDEHFSHQGELANRAIEDSEGNLWFFSYQQNAPPLFLL